MKNKVNSLGRQIAIRSTAPLAVLLALLVAFMMLGIQSVLSELKLREINEQTRAATQIVESHFEPYYAVNKVLADTDLINNIMKEASIKGESLRFETHQNYDELLDLLMTHHTALGDDVQSVWIAGIGNNAMLASTGFVAERGLDLTTRPWYSQVAENGRDTVITAAYTDLETGKIVVSIINGIYSRDQFIGIVGIDVALDGMSVAMDQISIGETGSVVVCDRDGSIIYSRNRDEIMHNVANHTYPEAMKKALALEIDTPASDKYIEDDNEYYSSIAYSSVLGWRLIGTMPNSEFIREAWTLGLPLFWAAIISVMITYAICALTGKSIAKPVRELSEVTSRLAAGDLDTEVSAKANNEIGVLANNIIELVARLKTYILYIDEASKVLGQMGDGNLRIALEQDYVGEFSQLKNSILSVRASLTDTISQISEAASQVDSGTSQISCAAQSLAQGTTEQASAVEELAVTISQLSAQSSDGAQVAKDLRVNFEEVNSNLSLSDERMQQLLGAMSDISEKSEKIGKIVKTISDIAFQTNILALNAAVEAARAGHAGKGFSVVADEVRSLASKCDLAAKDVTVLISDSTTAVTNGAALAEDTANALSQAASTMDAASKAMGNLADRYTQEANTLNEVANGIDQISVVVQTNSATAEQTAAGSEELAAQAKSLFTLTEKFNL